MIKSFNLVENVKMKNKFQLFLFGRLGQPVAGLLKTFYKGLNQNGLLADRLVSAVMAFLSLSLFLQRGREIYIILFPPNSAQSQLITLSTVLFSMDMSLWSPTYVIFQCYIP